MKGTSQDQVTAGSAPTRPSETRLIRARLTCIRYLADSINGYEFTPTDPSPPLEFSPGAHVDLRLPNGITRSYSLINRPRDLTKYVIAVKRNADGRGGSVFMHDHLRVGDIVSVGAPRNNFELREDGLHSVFIAGGIGITPFISMISRLDELRRPYELHYYVRNRVQAMLVSELVRGDLNLHVTNEERTLLTIENIVQRAPAGSHLYCCGPASMLENFLTSVRELPDDHVHFERFSGEAHGVETAFTVRLARSGQEVRVVDGQTILQALRAAGIGVESSCEQGICGTCETRVLAGIPDHKDSLLSDAEKTSGKTMLICCSGSRSAEMVLDL